MVIQEEKEDSNIENIIISNEESTPAKIRASLHRLFTRKTSSNMSLKKENKNRRMMTSGQLSDLFRRLDKDGNGELDLEEFTQIISKLQMNVSEEFVAKIFRKVNVSQSGTIKLQEFVSAYQLLFTRPSIASTVGSTKDNIKLRKPSELICAIRYGTIGDKSLFEMYLGTVIDLPDGPLFSMNEKRIYSLFPDEDPEDLHYDIVENWSASLSDINEIITQDSLNNKLKKSKLFWWIDIAMIKVAAHRMDKYIAGLGLPNDTKFRSAFSQFGTSLTRDEKSHVYLGNGSTTLGGVSSMSFFVQAMWITSLPISHHIPLWFDYLLESFPQAAKVALKDYYYKRFAFFLSSSSRINAQNEEKRNAYENSQIIVDRLEENDHFGDTTKISTKGNDKLSFNLLSTTPVPIRGVSKWKTEANWLLSMSDLKRHIPKLKYEDLSIHLLSQGHEPACLVTIREIDPEILSKTTKKTSILEDSKTGVLGRIITGLRIKIVKNLCSDGIVAIAGELTDSSAALASILISLTQSFSMNTLGSLVMWLKLISAGVDDLAVSKHSEHAKYLGDIVTALCDYVQPTYTFLQNLYTEGADILREEALEAEEAAAAAAEAEENGRLKLERLDSIHSSDDSDSEDDVDNGSPSTKSSSRRLHNSAEKKPFSKPLPSPRSNTKPAQSRRRTGMATEVQLSVATLPPGIHNLPITFSNARLFLGSSALHHLTVILDGDESLEVKGIKYWNEQLQGLNSTAIKTKDDIHTSLDEKRNFFSFILTVVTVGLAPMTLLTGYWGMNFDNMAELDPTTYPSIPGVKLVWFTIFWVYFAFLIMSVHFRILYSAT